MTVCAMGFLLLRKIISGNFKFREYTILENIAEIISIGCLLASEIKVLKKCKYVIGYSGLCINYCCDTLK